MKRKITGRLRIKQVITSLMSRSRVLDVLERLRLRDNAFVLMYHRVLTNDYLERHHVQPGMYVLLKTFEEHISFLKKNYRILFLEELAEMAGKGENIGNCCAITFDDGWLDNYTNVFPVLKKYQVPATIFLATGFVDTDNLFWPEEVSSLLKLQQLMEDLPHGLPLPVLRFRSEMNVCMHAKVSGFLDKAIELLKGFSSEERSVVIDHYRGLGATEHSARQLMSWENVTEMKCSGMVRFGAHTRGHEILDKLSPARARSEIVQSMTDIEQRLGEKVAAFAYPNGNYNKNLIELVAECGIGCAVTTVKGFLSRETLPLEIPRIGMHEDISGTLPMFRGRIVVEKF